MKRFSVCGFFSFPIAIFLPYVLCVSFAVDLSLAVYRGSLTPGTEVATFIVTLDLVVISSL